jgi:hypothetical protein
LPAPTTGKRHHPNRIKTPPDDVVLRVDRVDTDPEQFGDLGTGRRKTHTPLRTISKLSPDFGHFIVI